METKPQRRLLVLGKKGHSWKSTLSRLKKKSAKHWSISHIFFVNLL